MTMVVIDLESERALKRFRARSAQARIVLTGVGLILAAALTMLAGRFEGMYLDSVVTAPTAGK
jgi:hypothetical protein